MIVSLGGAYVRTPLTGTLISRFVGCAMFRFRIQLSAQFRQCVGRIIFPCNESFYEEAAGLALIPKCTSGISSGHVTKD